MKILVVGGGTAGLISALILKKRFNMQVDVVCSKNIGIIGVGEGSTEHFNEFLNIMGLDPFAVIRECDATYKSGIFFDNWSPSSYIHTIGGLYAKEIGQYPIGIAYKVQNGYQSLIPENLLKNVLHKRFLNQNNGERPFNQYHFNTYKLNEFLTTISKHLKINVMEDDINQVIFKESGEIDYLIGDKQNYNYDFYIDATGFKRLLIGKMGAKWISFGKYLKMKSAIVFPTPDEDEYNLWTLAKAMDYGWRFKIPTWGRHGNGYIFDSDYITADQAKEELDKEFGYDVEISKQFNFDPGHLDKVWIKNCVAIGLSGSFVEPLEATSIGSSIQQSFLLMNYLTNYTEETSKKYNTVFLDFMENIRDFIILHYITKKQNTVFWQDVAKIDLPESLKNGLNSWKNKMPILDDFITKSSYNMFDNLNFSVVMHGLRLFNIEKIKKEYFLVNKEAKIFFEKQLIEEEKDVSLQMKLGNNISHKQFLKTVRDNRV